MHLVEIQVIVSCHGFNMKWLFCLELYILEILDDFFFLNLTLSILCRSFCILTFTILRKLLYLKKSLPKFYKCRRFPKMGHVVLGCLDFFLFDFNDDSCDLRHKIKQKFNDIVYIF